MKSVRVFVIGAPYTGKTKIVNKVMNVQDTMDVYVPTIGVDVKIWETSVKLEGKDVKLFVTFFDFSGLDHFKTVREKYFEGLVTEKDLILAIYDVSSLKTLYKIPSYIREVLKERRVTIPLLIIGNKIDLVDKVKKKTLRRILSRIKRSYNITPSIIFTSVKTSKNIDKVREWIISTAKTILK